MPAGLAGPDQGPEGGPPGPVRRSAASGSRRGRLGLGGPARCMAAGALPAPWARPPQLLRPPAWRELPWPHCPALRDGCVARRSAG
eukprot:6033754-Alexandrium_andersonii.AAC.1